MYTISTAVPLEPAHGRSRVESYPFRDMTIGHSFEVISERERNAAMRAARYYMRHNPATKFTSRSFKGGYRIFREA